MDVNGTVGVVAVVGELSRDLSSGARKVARSASDGVQSSKGFVGVRAFPRELSGASVEINVGTFTEPHFSVVDAGAEFVVVSDRLAANLVVDGTRKRPRLSCIHRGKFQFINNGSISLNQGLGPFLRKKKEKEDNNS